MLFELCQGFLMWEDLYFRAVSPLICIGMITCAIFQGGTPVVLAILFSFLLIPVALKKMVGYIDLVLWGVYSGLLADVIHIGYFCLWAGGLGIFWSYFRKTPIPLVTMMGVSYTFIKVSSAGP